jgi:hypothetical protein
METEFLDTDPDGVGASSIGGSGGGSFYYGVTSVDDSGDESAQTLGSSPAAAAIGSSSGGGGGGGGAGGAGCFISVTGQSNSGQGLWMFALMVIILAGALSLKARRAAPQV